MMQPGGHAFFCTHDGNKNVSEVFFFQQAYGVAAHYEYAPFGAVTASTRNTSVTSIDARTFNPFRFSSEYADDTLGLVYYNYRHYETVMGRWCSLDPIGAFLSENLYCYCLNYCDDNDVLGLARLITFARRKWPGFRSAGQDVAARKLMRYIEGDMRNKKGRNQCPCYSVVIKDMIDVTGVDIVNELKIADYVFIISHGALRVNGKWWNGTYYEWKGGDVVEEFFNPKYSDKYEDAINIDDLIKAGFDENNMFGCYISPGHRKVKKYPMKYPMSSISHQSEDLNSLLMRLKQIVAKTKQCERTIKITIYEGERNGINQWYSTTRALKDKLHDEEYYYGGQTGAIQ